MAVAVASAPRAIVERPPPPQRRPWCTLRFIVLVLVLVAVALANMGLGAFGIPPVQVVAILLDAAGLGVGVGYTEQQANVLTTVRLPRAAMAGLVGVALGVSGAVYQGIFRNPLASPSLLGISSGASAAAAVAIALGLSGLSIWTLPAAAFAGALLTSLAIYRFARRGGRTEVTTLLLAGIAINALMAAIVSLMIYVAEDPELRSIVFWTLGSVSGATWPMVGASSLFIAVGLAFMLRYGRVLNLLILGDAVPFAPRAYPSLSGGEQARVNMARLLAQDAPVVLLDEPTAHLDPRHQHLVLRKARELADAGGSVLAVLHDLNLAALYADRVVMMAAGRVHGVGTPWEALTEPSLHEVFQLRFRRLRHPEYGCPLLLPMPDQAPASAPSTTTADSSTR